MLRTLNWMGILFGAGAGLLTGFALTVVAWTAGGAGGLLGVAVIASFVVAGFVAGRLSLVNRVPSGGFAAIILHFGLAIVMTVSGAEVSGVAVLAFGLFALAAGSLGGWLAERSRHEES